MIFNYYYGMFMSLVDLFVLKSKKISRTTDYESTNFKCMIFNNLMEIYEQKLRRVQDRLRECPLCRFHGTVCGEIPGRRFSDEVPPLNFKIILLFFR